VKQNRVPGGGGPRIEKTPAVERITKKASSEKSKGIRRLSLDKGHVLRKEKRGVGKGGDQRATKRYTRDSIPYH